MKTILVVEDNEDLRELLGEILRRDGYDVCEAENGRDALDRLERMNEPPCLLLLDLMMPVMTGQELLEVLRGRAQLVALPVVVLSAGGQPSQVPGARTFIRKPTDLHLLRDTVRTICGGP